jgi:oligoendopeptidase F
MELLAAPWLTEFYGEADHRRARLDHLEGIIKFFPWMACVDAFQHWIYTHPGHERDDRRRAWTDLLDRFGGQEDWSGYEVARECLWHRQLHIFEYPFYYVEYGIAQLGALQLWQQARNGAGVRAAVDNYLCGLQAGGSLPLPKLFEAMRIRFDFGTDTIAPLADALQREIIALRAGR